MIFHADPPALPVTGLPLSVCGCKVSYYLQNNQILWAEKYIKLWFILIVNGWFTILYMYI